MDGKKPSPPEPASTRPSTGTDDEGRAFSSPVKEPPELAGPPDDSLTLEEADPSQVEWVEVEEIKDELVHENKPDMKGEEKEEEASKERTDEAGSEDGKPVPPEAEVVEEMRPIEPGLLNGKKMTVSQRNGANGRNGNGLINGKGHINGEGLGRRQSLVNGNGLVNGRGLVNGKGLVNGMREKDWRDGPDGGQGGRYSRALAKRDRTRRIAKLAVGSVIALMLLTAIPAYMYLKEASEGMLVDGRFSDWSEMRMYSDGTDANITFGELDIVEYSMAQEGHSLFFYLKVAGDMMAGDASAEGVDVVNVYIDTDGQEGTGLSIHGIGADALIEIFGFNHIIHGRALYKFDDERDHHDWNGWVATGSTSSALSGGRMEMSFPMSDIGLSGPRNAIVLFQVLSTFSDEGDLSEALIGLDRASLVLEQDVLAPDIIPSGSTGTPFLGIRLEAKGGDVSLGSLTLTRDGDAIDADTGPVVLKGEGGIQVPSAFTGGDGALTFPISLELAAGGSWAANVLVDVQRRSLGHNFGLEVLDPENVSAGDAVVTLATRMSMKNVYLGKPPARIVIDGAFGDWEGVSSNTDQVGDSGNPNVDMRDTRAVKGDGTVSFYVKVDGTVMAGVPTPVRMAKMVPSGPSGPPGPPITPPPLPELVAADVVRIFIDTDNQPITGCPVQGMDMGADIALVVTGVGGRILDRQMFGWSIIHNDWSLFGTFDAANDADRMELQAPLEALGMTANSTLKAMVIATDWEDHNDTSDSPIIVIDPLQLNRTGEVNFSSDGNTWTYQTDLGSKTFVDLTVDASGFVYALANDGTVYKSTGDWTVWTQIINNYGASTGFIAIDTDSGTPQWFFALATNGSVYNTSGSDWSYRGSVGNRNDYIDMCWANGTNTSATLLAIRSGVNGKVRTSSNGGSNWVNLGFQNIGNDGNGEANVAIVHGSAWGGSYIFVLQDDGDVRYDTVGTAVTPWAAITTPASDNYTDMDYATGGMLWIVTANGQTYKFASSGSTAGGGSWNTLGNTSMGAVNAIAVGEIPEFRDVLIPLVGTIAMVILLRRRARVRTGR